MNIETKLSLNVFKIDTQSHIVIDHAICQTQCLIQYCLYICPAELYSKDTECQIQVNYEGCLECGACFIACSPEALSWQYPRAGHGVQYRFG